MKRSSLVGPASVLLAALCCVACKEEAGAKRSSTSGASQFNQPVAEAPVQSRPSYPEIEALRKSIPGGQVLLPDDPVFAKGIGWWQTDYTQNESGWMVTTWTKGDYQVLDWAGPETPGDYDLVIEMWRHHPFPTEQITIEYLLPGASAKETMDVPLGQVLVKGRITVREPGEPLHLEMRVPSWIPKDRIPGSTDPRDIGFLLTKITLTPVGAEEPGGTEPAPTAEN